MRAGVCVRVCRCACVLVCTHALRFFPTKLKQRATHLADLQVLRVLVQRERAHLRRVEDLRHKDLRGRRIACCAAGRKQVSREYSSTPEYTPVRGEDICHKDLRGRRMPAVREGGRGGDAECLDGGPAIEQPYVSTHVPRWRASDRATIREYSRASMAGQR